jgi:tetratricopeptide (TPR) repeat protein
LVQADPLVYPAEIYAEKPLDAEEVEGLRGIYIPRPKLPLNLQTEWEVVSGALTGDIPVKLVRLYPPTPRRLEDYILRGAAGGSPINVLHLSCHGAPFKGEKICSSKELEEVRLLLENEDGVVKPYSAAKLGRLIKDAGINPPSLIVVSACYSGFAPDCDTEPIFIEGLRNALTELEAPMPTIIGMTEAVEDNFSNWYTAELYNLLSMGIELSLSHERAVERAREKFQYEFGEDYDFGLPAIVSEGVVGEKPVPAEAGVEDRRVPGGYPPEANPPATFVGREVEQVAIARLLNPASTAARDVEGVCVTGPSGMGKSVLAQVIFSRNAWRFTGENDRMAWVRLVAAESADDFLSRVGLGLGVRFEDKPEGTPEEIIAAKKRQVFGSLGSGKNLLVLDNLESVISGGDAAALRILKQLVNDRRVFVIMTSQVPSEAAGVRPFDLEGLGERAGVFLFVNILRVRGGEQSRAYREALKSKTEVKPEVVDICDFLDYEPLMLEQVAANLADDYEPYDVVLRELRQGERKYLEFVGDKGEPRHKSQWTAFEYSYERLPEEGTAREALAVAGCFAPGVPEVLLAGAAPHAYELYGDLRLLTARGFLAKGELASGAPAYWMHPVRAEFALEFAGDELRKIAVNAAARVLHGLVSGTVKEFKAGGFDYARVTSESLVFPNAAWLLREKYAREIEPQITAAIYHDLGNLFYLVLRYEEAEGKYNDSLVKREEVRELAREALNRLHKLGMTSACMSGPAEEPEVMYATYKEMENLAIEEELAARAAAARTLYNLGTLYAETNRPEEAEAKYKESLAIAEELGNRAGAASTLHKLGVLYADTNRPAEAEEKSKESLRIFVELGDRANEAIIRYQLGKFYTNTDRPEEAKAEFKKSLAIAEELGDRAGAAKSSFGINSVKFAGGDYRGAALFAAQGLLFALLAEKADLVEFGAMLCGDIRDKIPAGDFMGIIRAALAEYVDDKETLEKYYNEIVKIAGI